MRSSATQTGFSVHDALDFEHAEPTPAPWA